MGEIFALFKSNPKETVGAIFGFWLVSKIIASIIPNSKVDDIVARLGAWQELPYRTAGKTARAAFLKWLPAKYANRAEQGIIGTLCTLAAKSLYEMARGPLWFLLEFAGPENASKELKAKLKIKDGDQ
jgi:hypothetical protein